MSKLNVFRECISEILSAAALEIFGVVEKTLIEYKKEISRSEEERKRLQRLLNVVTQPNIAEVQQLSLLEPPQIKEEQELWTSQEEEQLQALQSETTDSTFTSSSVEHDWDQDGSSECSHLVQIVKVEDREGDSLPTNTTEEQINADPEEHNYAATEPGSDSQSLSFVAPDCPAAQSLEEEHGGVMLLPNRTQNNEALPKDNRPQGSHTGKTIHQFQQCNNTFTSKSHCIMHMRTHTGEKPFQCQQCNRRFAQKGYLVRHMRTHTGQKPFQCQQCNKQFSDKGNLVCHMRTHTGEKPHQCQQCNKTFCKKFHLAFHMRSHTAEKPFSCKKCYKQFTDEGYLVRHMKRHPGEKPIQCQQCNKTFAKKGTLTSHMRTHTRKKKHKCEECNKRFHHKGHFDLHVRTHGVQTISVSTL
ncbi:zinc finger protein 260-like [Osmerus mordax]|uniref:zinc finger protein 260-like n=1 Tax=Osmerus mordax TaxID=8014 RepID=UPI0035103EC7